MSEWVHQHSFFSLFFLKQLFSIIFLQVFFISTAHVPVHIGGASLHMRTLNHSRLDFQTIEIAFQNREKLRSYF